MFLIRRSKSYKTLYDKRVQPLGEQMHFFFDADSCGGNSKKEEVEWKKEEEPKCNK